MTDDDGKIRWRQNPYTLLAGLLILVAALAAAMHAIAVAVVLSIGAVAILAYQPSRNARTEPIAASVNETLPVTEAPRDNIGITRAALSAIDMPLYLIDGRENIVFQNGAAAEAFGDIEPNAHITTRLRSPAILDCVRETIATGNVNTVEYTERHPSTRVYLVRVAPIAPEGSRPTHFILSFRDISESRVVERMRSDFVANASHELRTPLASLQGFIETLQGPAKNDPKAGERFLGIMLEQVQRMNRLVDDLLSLSRLELKAHIAPSDRVDLLPLLGHVRDALQPLAASLDVEIVVDLPNDPVFVAGDRDELIQVFENLVQNACKYGQEGKRIEVTLTPATKGQGAEVSIRDFGPGIAEEHIPRLTERFYRVNVEASRSKKGTGLGLAIVKHILTRHRARLIVQSEMGKGSVFTVRF
ncbi:phosphate regulon sensor histidine kinase PhoR [Rhizobium sp. C4]|uniref:phosphate regulon sensor histidine kinase PhoR n=1 Tax=Rhizobium sp. C4 TaxID=1349800 RepID=UPI001E2C7337|nr:phosphate regulon sensor histidine kinase PhoR [Rhizobium sp. C4]MCD2174567.1 phosphate regulon sensor histidine kinase PhoR [Rhizobium sp. C4]